MFVNLDVLSCLAALARHSLLLVERHLAGHTVTVLHAILLPGQHTAGLLQDALKHNTVILPLFGLSNLGSDPQFMEFSLLLQYLPVTLYQFSL